MGPVALATAWALAASMLVIPGAAAVTVGSSATSFLAPPVSDVSSVGAPALLEPRFAPLNADGDALSSTVAIALASRTADAIYNRFDQLKPSYAGTPYAQAPRWSAPYAAGALTSGFAADGIKALNFLRFVAGLPDDVVLDPAEQDRAMHGAVLLAASTFSHTPPQPEDMPKEFYDVALSSTTRSNIGSGYSDLESFQLACMDDDSPGNLATVGHRRWILNPPLAKTGMGFADNRLTTYATDRSRASAVDYDFIAWPPAGPMPVQLFGTSVPWSVTLNPDRYDWTSEPHTVTLRRTRDGKTWTFTSSDTDTAREFFSFNTGGYGIANCFIFRPDPSEVAYQPGDAFEVTVSGGIYYERTTTAAVVRYTTTFIPLGRPDAYEDDDSSAAAKPLARGQTASHTIDHPGDVDWHAVAASKGAAYQFSVKSDAAAGSVTVAIYDGSTKLLERVIAGSAGFVWTAPGTKTYLVKVTGRASSRLAVPSYSISLGDPLTVTEVAGPDRYLTAVEVSKKAFPNGGVDTVVIATGANWPDALGGAALAGALGGPILLTKPTALPAEVEAEIARLGAKKAVILGGPLSVSTAVETALAKKLSVKRIAGSDRYETARLVAAQTVALLGDKYDGRAFVATGGKFPDALAASPLAAAEGWPIYLVDPGRGVDAALAKAMVAAKVRHAVVLGGTLSVSSQAQSDLAAKVGCTTARLYGSDRYGTALAVAEYGVAQAGLRYDALALSTGENFPDALAGGVLQARCGSVMLLTPSTSLDPAVAEQLAGLAGTVSEVRFLGGPISLTEDVRSEVIAALK